MKTFHITYFIERGNPEEGISPLLGGVTVEHETIILAIGKFVHETGVNESEIKYAIEL